MSATSKVPTLTPDDLFKSAQQPNQWLISAERLRAAADVILQDQVKREIPFFRAYEAAVQEALPHACVSPEGAAHAEIKCEPPNYRPAQLLYAYAIENVLKGLMIANDSGLADNRALRREITSHDLVALARKAKFELFVQETPVMAALSRISEWAGRYPVARTPERHGATSDPDALLDWGAQHSVTRRCFDRAVGELEKKLKGPRTRFGVVVVFGPKTA
jgi:hypothetical protein